MEDKRDKEELEEKKEKNTNKNGNTLGVVLVALLLVGLSVACGWFANSYFSGNSNKTNTEKNASEESVEKGWKSLGTDISKVKDTYDTVKDYMYIKNLPSGGLSLDKEETMNIIAQRYQETDLIDFKNDANGVGQGFLSYDKVDSILKKYLGNNYKISTTCDTSSWCVLGSYGCTAVTKYDSNTKLFTLGWGPCDGHGPSGPGDDFKYYFAPLRKITDVQEKDDEIKVIEKVIYTTYRDEEYDGYEVRYDVYSSPEKTNKIGQLVVSLLGATSNKNYVDDYLDKAGTITSYYHKAEDGTYYFVSSEISG